METKLVFDLIIDTLHDATEFLVNTCIFRIKINRIRIKV